MAPIKPFSSNKKGILSRIVLPEYMLDSSLILLPGIIYNVTFTRFKAATLLSRFRSSIDSMVIIKSLLNEYDLDDMESPTLSEDALAGIQTFKEMESIHKSSLSSASLAGPFGDVILAIEPNTSKITSPEGNLKNRDNTRVATLCRIIGITDDSKNVRLTVQALARAIRAPEEAKHPSELIVSVVWDDNSPISGSQWSMLKTEAIELFGLIERFLDEYKQALAAQKKDSDLLTLNPLANALYLQLAGSKEFSKAYQTLQKVYSSTKGANSNKNLLKIVDLTAAIVPFPNYEKLRILSISDASKRTEVLTQLITKMTEVFTTIRDNNTLLNHWFYEEASNIQKASLVANQLRSIRLVLDGLSTSSSNKSSKEQKQLVRRKDGFPTPPKTSQKNFGGVPPRSNSDDDDDDDDLKAISDFINKKLPEITSLSEDSKRLIVKDFKRVKSSNPGNADFHVLRNYLEIVADMPWDKYVTRFKSNKDIDLTEARAQLDKDHFGLENVKNRLIQYLVVLKLLGANADKEIQRISTEEAKQKQKLSKDKESKKFTRESANGESIIIPYNEDRETSSDQQVDDLTVDDQDTLERKSAIHVSKENKSPIIMLAGPPGVGKTSLAKSIATTLGRAFQRVSLGGVKDESEIRGHRRTYVGAMPGTIVQAIRKSRSMNPVILLDEIDKIIGGNSGASKFNGDPAAALLEVLDPEQNNQFVDHYLGFPIDLSQVIFVCTANEPYNLSRPLLDRLEMIEIGAYDYSEKLAIGNTYLLPRQVTRNGLPQKDLVYLDEDVMKKVILDYTREAGVRNFERKLGTICRYKAVEYSESLADPQKVYRPKVEEYDLSRYLGVPHPAIGSEIIESPAMASPYGVVNGLSYNTDGSGSVLIFESIGFDNGKGSTSLNMTGRLGEVLMESAKIGITFIKDMLRKKYLNLNDKDGLVKRLDNLEIHMHVPAGAIQKDGPSAGITMALLFLSLVLKKPVPSHIAMTGELTLRGLVLPIGGLKEKILGAYLTGQIKQVIVPRQNRKDIIDEYVHKINDLGQLNALLDDDSKIEFENNAPEQYFFDKYGISIVYAREFGDVIRHVWGKELLYEVETARLHL